MLNGQETRALALNPEEAALLPALTRPVGGRAALKTALRASESMAKKKTGRTVGASFGAAVPPKREETRLMPGKSALSRAALYHILRKR